jgi:hypothetical protein
MIESSDSLLEGFEGTIRKPMRPLISCKLKQPGRTVFGRHVRSRKTELRGKDERKALDRRTHR